MDVGRSTGSGFGGFPAAARAVRDGNGSLLDFNTGTFPSSENILSSNW
jgi:hypothetical protein